MAKKHHYMTHDERVQLEALHTAKVPVAQIAKQLGFCRQTIYNELKRGEYTHTCEYWDEQRYSAEKGQSIHNYNQTAKGRPLKIGNDHAYANFLEDKILHDKYSPAAALAAARRAGYRTSICVTTLYRYIDKGIFLNLSNKDLWEKSKQKPRAYKPIKRIVHPKLPSIINRPDYINNRKEIGHWEMDLIVGKANTKTVLLTLTERVTKQEIIVKLPNRKAETVRKAFDQMERNGQQFQSITTDNGMEFLQYERLRKSVKTGNRFDIYYCHSYAAWEKGTNENHNRMIRRWFPKGTDFTKITQKEITRVQDWMNNYPRKSLGWLCPNDYA